MVGSFSDSIPPPPFSSSSTLEDSESPLSIAANLVTFGIEEEDMLASIPVAPILVNSVSRRHPDNKVAFVLEHLFPHGCYGLRKFIRH